MAIGIIAVFIPIIVVLVLGLMYVTYYYFRFRERQMLIEKGLDTQSIKEFFENKKKRNPFILMQIGIISIAFGIGLGAGMSLQESYDKDFWIPLMLFVMTGIGFVVANLTARKLESKTIE